MADRQWKVKLRGTNGLAVFDASAVVPESRRANYESYNLVHMPADLYAFRNTSSRTFGVQARLVSRNAGEANKNTKVLSLIRSWILPDFVGRLGAPGAPPPILKFSAYNNTNIKELNVVITSYSWTFDDQTDYIFKGVIDPMPVIGNLSVELLEIYSAQQITDVTPWDIKIVGSDSSNNSPVIKVSRRVVFGFAGPRDQAVGGGGGGGGSNRVGRGAVDPAVAISGGRRSSIPGISSSLVESFTQVTPVSRNPFVAGTIAAAPGVLAQSLNPAQAGLVNPLSELHSTQGETTAVTTDNFGRQTVTAQTPLRLEDV